MVSPACNVASIMAPYAETSTCPCPEHFNSTRPSPLKKVLPPPQLESTSTLGSEAIHEPDWTIRELLPGRSTTVMSPGSAAATPTTPPPDPAEKSFTKKLSPPRLRFSPLRIPPWVDVAIVM